MAPPADCAARPPDSLCRQSPRRRGDRVLQIHRFQRPTQLARGAREEETRGISFCGGGGSTNTGGVLRRVPRLRRISKDTRRAAAGVSKTDAAPAGGGREEETLLMVRRRQERRSRRWDTRRGAGRRPPGTASSVCPRPCLRRTGPLALRACSAILLDSCPSDIIVPASGGLGRSPFGLSLPSQEGPGVRRVVPHRRGVQGERPAPSIRRRRDLLVHQQSEPGGRAAQSAGGVEGDEEAAPDGRGRSPDDVAPPPARRGRTAGEEDGRAPARTCS